MPLQSPQGRTTHHARSAGIPPSIAPRRRLACAGAASCVGANSCGINQAIASFARDPRKRENRQRKLPEMRKSRPAVQAPLLLAGETRGRVAGQQNYICGSPGAHLSERRRQIRMRDLRKSLPAVQAFLLLLAGDTRPRRVAG